MQVRLENINPDNWRILNSLKVKAEQEKYIAANVSILAKAYAYRMDNSKVYAVYNESLPVGLLMQRDFVRDGQMLCILDQFMIAEQYQGKGIGKLAMQQWLTMIKTANKYEAVILCYIEGDEIARNLYDNMGFIHTGEREEDEIIMIYKLKERNF